MMASDEEMNHTRRALDLGLCARCLLLYMETKKASLLKETEEQIAGKLTNLFGLGNLQCGNVCPSCCDILRDATLNVIKVQVLDTLRSKNLHGRRLDLSFKIDPVIDLLRITARNVIFESAEKLSSFPSLSDVCHKFMRQSLRSLNIGNSSDSTVVVTITVKLQHQLDVFMTLCPGAILKKKKKRKYAVVESEQDEDDVSQMNVEAVLASLKGAGAEKLGQYLSNMKALASAGPQISLSVSATSCPYYLLGRYRKLARDVPQAAWIIDNKRKGRASVEEILAEQVMRVFGATGCQMHACGREDIDVRCLGNGRPFVLEVTGATDLASLEGLSEVVRAVQALEGLNAKGDIELVGLKQTPASTWHRMQGVAEEKRKGYRCVVWTSTALDRAKLQSLEDACQRRAIKQANGDEEKVDGGGGHDETEGGGGGEDEGEADAGEGEGEGEGEEGADGDDGDERGAEDEPFLQIIQKTPLRVLHRRSLLSRRRRIYRIRTTQLSSNFFLLDLVTSAGTYVKEFVHGDMGRTSPNVGSILGCEADILQLDVVWLFDDFEGGGHPPSDTDADTLDRDGSVSFVSEGELVVNAKAVEAAAEEHAEEEVEAIVKDGIDNDENKEVDEDAVVISDKEELMEPPSERYTNDHHDHLVEMEEKRAKNSASQNCFVGVDSKASTGESSHDSQNILSTPTLLPAVVVAVAVPGGSPRAEPQQQSMLPLRVLKEMRIAGLKPTPR